MQTFGPKVLTIKAGTTAIFKNVDVGMPCNVYGVKGEFPSPMLQPGDPFAKRFDEKGEVHFTCAPRPG